MEKRFFLALGLSLLVLMAWNLMFPPEAPPEPVAIEATGAPEPDATMPADDSAPAAPDGAAEGAPPSSAVPGYEPVAASEERQVVIENDLYRIVLTNVGARVVSWKLKQYHDPEGNDLELVPCVREDDAPMPLRIDLDDPALTEEINRRAIFEIERAAVPADGDRGPGESVTFRWADGQGIEVVKMLTVRDGYIGDIAIDVLDRGRRRPVRVAWGPGFQARGSGAGGRVTSYYNYAGQAVWNRAGTVERTPARKLEDTAFRAPIAWAGLEDQYFAALVLPGSETSEIRTWSAQVSACAEAEGGETGAEAEQEARAQTLVAVSVPEGGARLFVGPKRYRLLTGLGNDLDRVVWFSSYPLLAAIARGLFLALLWIHDHIVANWGVAILLATFALRIVLFPLNQYSMVRMKKAQIEMQRIQPKLNGIKKKYQKKKDAQSRAQMNQEMMELYRKEGISPMGGVFGCLPLLAQFPILIGFYNMLTVAIELRGAPFFGWIQDLSQHDRFWVLPILMGVTMFYQQRLAQSKVTDPVQKQQQKIMMIMPFFFTYLCIQMPSGMVLYWFANNLLGIGQQWLVNRHTQKLEAAS